MTRGERALDARIAIDRAEACLPRVPPDLKARARAALADARRQEYDAPAGAIVAARLVCDMADRPGAWRGRATGARHNPDPRWDMPAIGMRVQRRSGRSGVVVAQSGRHVYGHVQVRWDDGREDLVEIEKLRDADGRRFR